MLPVGVSLEYLLVRSKFSQGCLAATAMLENADCITIHPIYDFDHGARCVTDFSLAISAKIRIAPISSNPNTGPSLLR